MYQVLLVIYLLVAVSLVTLIILQQGRGIDMSASLGASISNNLFSSVGCSNLITRIIVILATLFFAFSLLFSNLSSLYSYKDSQWNAINQVQHPDQELVKVLDKISNNVPQ